MTDEEMKALNDAMAAPKVEEKVAEVPVEETVIEKIKSEFEIIHDRLHEELAVLTRGRGESEIGLSEPYWAKLNELRLHIHNNK